jgi:Outer membrane protein beta-barrel domain
MKAIIGLILFCSSCLAYAQKSDCIQLLNQAENEFNAGHFYGLSSLLQDCLESNGFTNEQKVRVYMLLTQSYLLTDDPIAAENSFLSLLKADPEYVADEKKDPVDVYYLSKKFTTTPRFIPTLFKLGTNTSFIKTIHRINTNSTPDSTREKHNLKLGFQIGTGIDWNVNDNFSIGTELGFAQRSFETTVSGIFGDDDQVATENQYWFDVPVYVKYADHLGPVRPFGYVGFSLNFLISDKAKLEYNNRTPAITPGESSDENRTQGPDVDLMYKRNFFNRSIVFGGGIRYKLGKDFIMIDARYIAGLSNITNEKRNFYNDENDQGLDMASTSVKYSFIGDYFRVNNLSLSVGYVKPLYDPRKIKKAHTKSAMKRISKQKEGDKK